MRDLVKLLRTSLKVNVYICVRTVPSVFGSSVLLHFYLNKSATNQVTFSPITRRPSIKLIS